MARATWPLHHGRPAIAVHLVVPETERVFERLLLADTGAGSNAAPFELLLDEEDCVNSAQHSGGLVGLSGAYSGEFQTYIVKLRLPDLDVSILTTAVGTDRPPEGFDGIAAFRFLNRFAYGNFGLASQFGLELKPIDD
jgi:hypothetical protein